MDKQSAELKANDEAGDAVVEEVAEEGATLTAVIEVTEEATDLSGLLAEFGGVQGLRDALSAITANAQQQKAQAISRIVANRANAFTKQNLEAMPLEVVLKLDRTLTPANYAGAGGLAVNSQDEWGAYEMPKVG